MKTTLLSAAAFAATLCLGTWVTAQERDDAPKREERRSAAEERDASQREDAQRNDAQREDSGREDAERREAQREESGREDAQRRDAQNERGARNRQERSGEQDPNRQIQPGRQPIQPAPGQPLGQGTFEQAPQQGGAQGQQNRFALGIRLDAAGADIMIDEVLPNSPAQEAGLREGDMILSVNGSDPRNVNDFLSAVSRVREGEAIQLEIEREGETQQVEVTPAPWNEVFAGRPAAGQPGAGQPGFGPQTTFRPNFAGNQGMSREMETLRQQVQQLQREVEQLRAQIQGGAGAAREPRAPRDDLNRRPGQPQPGPGAAPPALDAPPAIDAPPARRPGAEGDARPNRSERPAPRGEREGDQPRRNTPRGEQGDDAPPAAPETN